MNKNSKSIIISALLLFIIIGATIISNIYWGNKKYTQKDFDKIEKQYRDSIEFIQGQLDLQQEKANAQQDRVSDLEKDIDSLTGKHETTKKKLIPYNEEGNVSYIKNIKTDTSYTLAPSEYINECENCFALLGNYKKENIQLKFERDGYDSLMRQQASIQEKRINDLNWDNNKLRIKLSQSKCDTTWKIKLNFIGMFSDPFLPKGGGGGFIYEDKKFNDFGANVVFTNKGNIYIFNFAKTISLRRKK